MALAVAETLDLERILTKGLEEAPLNRQEILYLLGLENEDEIAGLFSAARAVRDRNFDKKIFMYGFVYFSTHCRNNCSFCLYRKSNSEYSRYRKTEAEVLETAQNLKDSGVHLLDFTMGEDPHYYSGNHAGFTDLYAMVRKVKQLTGLPVMISPGLVPEKVLAEFRQAGVDWYACYQETHNRELYNKLRLGQSYEQRMASKLQAHRQGLLIEEGLLTGVGDSPEDVADSLQAMQQLH
ncbi:MAG TPA: radical SAM protein, partial [Bacillota bacterium]|nr:radical SAM protein [Bacillota bacterium]